MTPDDLERFESDLELTLYREYRDVAGMFEYVVETDRRFYLANQVDTAVHGAGGDVWIEVVLHDAWVWDMYRPARFIQNVRVLTFRDVNIERVRGDGDDLPAPPFQPEGAE